MLPLYGKTVTEWSVGEHGAFVKKCGTQFPESRQGAVLSRGRGRRHIYGGIRSPGTGVRSYSALMYLSMMPWMVPSAISSCSAAFTASYSALLSLLMAAA